MIEMEKKRIFYYDILRALAIVGIITCHMTTSFMVNINNIHGMDRIFILFFNSLRQFAIPLFVMISGALLINKDYSIGVFIKKKFNRIFIPYIFWVVVLILFSILLLKFGISGNIIDNLSPDYLLNVFLGLNKGFAKGRLFWFIWMILTVYIVLFILNKILVHVNDSKKNRIIDGLVLLFIIYTILAPIVKIPLSPFKNTILYYLSFTGYGLVGYYLANRDFTNIFGKIRTGKKTIIACSLILFLILYGTYILIQYPVKLSFGIHFTYGTYFNILTVILSSSVFLFFRYIEENYENKEGSLFIKIRDGKAGQVINSLSFCSFGIYFVHPIVYIFYRFVVFGSVDIVKHNPIKWSSLLIVLVLFTSWGIIWIMSKIPYVEKVSGA